MIALKDVLLFFRENAFPIMIGFIIERVWFIFKLFLPSIDHFNINISSEPNVVIPEGSVFQHEDIYGNLELFVTLVPTLTDESGKSNVLVRRTSLLHHLLIVLRRKF